ncbi:spt3 [Verticillium alfalfae VaMs.102]|uniref:Spt3 n=1 Tax=Verticillium alfalfae (strain VaMs.102 / ATCC MYA-4576 / FGSC 10136) TaxID=526221 RepID=C9S7B0_VERA1|nr:spt3 [Verticillium alfalfae VaMs.102]EEY14695.1 spt3 [Verticillium alfalfae VaMs.102]
MSGISNQGLIDLPADATPMPGPNHPTPRPGSSRGKRKGRPRGARTLALARSQVQHEAGELFQTAFDDTVDACFHSGFESIDNVAAARRGSRSININDLIFQIRHDTAKVSRLRTFLSWKDVRKNVKDSDDKGGDADLGAGEDPVGGVAAGGPVDDAAKKNKKAKVGLPWEPSSFYPVDVPERDDEEDEEEEEMNFITLQRLRKADERTKAMTKEDPSGRGALKAKGQEVLVKGAERWRRRSRPPRPHGRTKAQQGLFDPPSEGKTPIEPRHVQEAFRRLQQRPKKIRAMLNGSRLPIHTTLNII